MKKTAILLLLGCLPLVFAAFLLPRGGKKAAYRNYYVGTFYFQEENWGGAVRNFRRAYNAVPEEFNFALALALALGHTGADEEALEVLREGAVYLSDDDPLLRRKHALRHYVTGMVHQYAGRFDQAVAALKPAIELLTEPADAKLLSIVYNTLGYAAMLNQGNNAHKPKDRPSHIHIHSRDLKRSVQHFARALELDGANEAALYNYTMLCDSLGITPEVFSRRAAVDPGQTDDYGSIPKNIYSLLDFTPYDEIVFLLDISGSMVMEKVLCVGEDRFRVMKETARYMFEQIPEDKRLGIGTIGGDCGTTPRLWHRVGELNRTDFSYALDFLVPDGTTPLLNILMETPALFSDDMQTRKAIFLISDGANICRMGNVDICEWADQLNGRRINIHIMTFLNADLSNTNAFAEYTCLAQNTYGELLYIDANRCSARPFAFNLAEKCPLFLPEMERLSCWGPAVKNLWGIYSK